MYTNIPMNTGHRIWPRWISARTAATIKAAPYSARNKRQVVLVRNRLCESMIIP